MWTSNVKVIRTYTSSHSKNVYAIFSGISGWKKVEEISTDGVTNCCIMVNSALANNRTVSVYIVSNKVERLIMY